MLRIPFPFRVRRYSPSVGQVVIRSLRATVVSSVPLW